MATRPRQISPPPTAEELAETSSKRKGHAPVVAHFSYHGGPLLTAVQVVTIFWGADWTQPTLSVLIPQLNQFFDFILTSSLIDLLGEYGVPGQPIGHGSRIPTPPFPFTDTEPGGGGGQLSDNQLQQALQGWISNNRVPSPTSNTVYFVYLPPGVTATDNVGDVSCQDDCGYHYHINGTIFYAVIPFPSCGRCKFAGKSFDSLTIGSSHELCESITDPTFSGWSDDNAHDEIGEPCAANIAQLGVYKIQKIWSNCATDCLSAPSPSCWGGWESLGGDFDSDIIAVSWASHRLDCLAVDDSAMMHTYWDGSKWHTWENLGGNLTSDISAVSWAPNRLDCFGVDADTNAMMHTYWDGSHWHAWENLGGNLTSDITAVSWAPNRLDCFAVDVDGAMLHTYWDGSKWHTWENLGGNLTSDIAAVSWAPNRLDCFAVGDYWPDIVTIGVHEMMHKWWDGSKWHAWESLGGNLTSDIAAVAWGPHRLDCFARGADDDMLHKWWHTTGY